MIILTSEITVILLFIEVFHSEQTEQCHSKKNDFELASLALGKRKYGRGEHLATEKKSAKSVKANKIAGCMYE